MYALVICCTIIGVKLLVGDYPPPENEHRISEWSTADIKWSAADIKWSEIHAPPLSHTQSLSTPLSSDTRNTVYILLSQPRSGSSWVGSFFDAHEDVFFVYEPFHPKAYENSDQHLSTEVMQVLKTLAPISPKGHNNDN